MQSTKKSSSLLFMCWLVYSCSYLGKVNYSANINQIMADFSVDHASAGLVSTFFFFAYGIGQIVNGLFCKKYNIKWMVFLSLVLSGAVNLGITVTSNFEIIKFLWLINGVGMSILWPTLIRLLSEQIPRKEMSRASVTMGTTVATGTFVIYGLSAVFDIFSKFRLSFLTPGLILPSIAVIWIFAFDKITVSNTETIDVEEAKKAEITKIEPQTSHRGLMTVISLLAVFAVATNLIKDGLTTWVPSILKETYELSGSFSIILTLLLPALAIFGNLLSVKLYNKIPSFIAVAGILFSTSAIFVGFVIIMLSQNLFVITISSFAIVNLLVSSSNSLITSIFPLYMKGKVNSGLIAGILNGFCYVGSTISSYGLGLIADKTGGWSSVFYFLLFVCIFVTAVSLAYLILKRVCDKKCESASSH